MAPAPDAAYACTLRVTLGAALPADAVLGVAIGLGFANPSGADRPVVTAAPGCANLPLPSPYLGDGTGRYPRYDLNVSTGGCAAGAEVAIRQAVAGPAGLTITQTVAVRSGPDLGVAFTNFVLPPAAGGTPTPAATATRPPASAAAPPSAPGAPRASDGQTLADQADHVQAAFVAHHGAPPAPAGRPSTRPSWPGPRRPPPEAPDVE